MGRELDIYMFDSARATTFLHRDLESTELFEISFRDFIQERKLKIGDTYRADTDQILNVVGTNIQQIAPDDLFEIIYFLDEEMYKKYRLPEYTWDKYETELEKLYIHYGLIHLYETQGSTAANGFLIHLYHFLNYYPGLEATGDYSKEDEGGNLHSRTFHLFLNYMILLMFRLMEQKVDPDFAYEAMSDEQIFILQAIREETSENHALKAMIEEDVANIVDFWNTWKDSSREPMANMVYEADNFFRNCIHMKKKITSDYSRIVVLDH